MRNGTPRNGPCGEACRDRLARAALHQVDHRVDLRIDGRGPRQRLVEQLGRRHLSRTDELGQAERVVLAVFRESHGASPER